jgi:hypothetical protein
MTYSIIPLFNQARTELYCPPCRLSFELKDERKIFNPVPLSVLNGVVSLKGDIIPIGADPEKCLLWYFRHELAHIHHCPYDLKTAHNLQRSAFEVVRRWDLSYLATYIFSELQINLNYLPRRFNETPYPMQIFRNQDQKGLEQILIQVYKQVQLETEHLPTGSIAEVAKEIYAILRSNRPRQWHIKVQMIAVILERLMKQSPRLFSKKKLAKFIQSHLIPVREDFHPDSIGMIEETYGTIRNREEAQEFFKQWINPRLSSNEKEKVKEALRKKIRIQRRKRRWKGKVGEKKIQHLGEGQKSEEELKDIEIKHFIPNEITSKEEPRLPTSLSQPYKKVDSKILDEAHWKRYWYRSRAENTIIQYLTESPSRRLVKSSKKYPDEWHIDDEIEALDIEMSLDEGSLRPEVNTQKWIVEPITQGQSMISGLVPSAIIVLDVSSSMLNYHDEAATAAFIAYLSAKKAGGKLSTLIFSTKYITSNWNDLEENKELVLSLAFDEFTIFPTQEIMDLTSKAATKCFILIITDSGWQNFEEAISTIQKIADIGHKVFIFQTPGGKYSNKIEKIKRSPELKIFKVDHPERDLKGLVLSQTMKNYETFLI